MKAGKYDKFDTESEMKAVFSGLNFDMVNVGLIYTFLCN